MALFTGSRRSGACTVFVYPIDPEQQAELVAERIRQRPKYNMGILGLGVLDKKRAINEVRARTPIGRALIEVEQRMIERLIKRACEKDL